MKRRFKSRARVSGSMIGRSTTRIIAEGERVLCTSIGSFHLVDGRWLWIANYRCELHPEPINEGRKS